MRDIVARDYAADAHLVICYDADYVIAVLIEARFKQLRSVDYRERIAGFGASLEPVVDLGDDMPVSDSIQSRELIGAEAFSSGSLNTR